MDRPKTGIASYSDEELKAAHIATTAQSMPAAPVPPRHKRGFTVAEILGMDFPPPTWIIPDLLTVGLTILAGAPKLGKSWLALALGTGVGSGGAVLGAYRVEQRDALYLALEDTPRRLKNRLEKISAAASSRLTIFSTWPSGPEGIADLDSWLTLHPETKLVLIDTLAKFRGQSTSDDRYSADYAVAGAIKAVADKHDAAIVVIHHVRKMGSDDIMDMVSGSNGLNGAADATWILTKARGESDATLFCTGRDIEEQSLALTFDKDIATWRVLGDAAEYSQSKERREVLAALPLGAAKKTSEIADAIGKKPQATGYLLNALAEEGIVKAPAHGGYWTRIQPCNPCNTVTVTDKQSPELPEVTGIQGLQGYSPTTEPETGKPGAIPSSTLEPGPEPPTVDYDDDDAPSGAYGEDPEYCEPSKDPEPQSNLCNLEQVPEAMRLLEEAEQRRKAKAAERSGAPAPLPTIEELEARLSTATGSERGDLLFQIEKLRQGRPPAAPVEDPPLDLF